MYRDFFIADAVVHGYNWTEKNYALGAAKLASEAGYGAHVLYSPTDSPAMLTRPEFLRDWQPDELEEALFLEAGADIVSYHGTPIYDLWKDGHSATDKGVEWKQREPHRVFLYGAVNPLDGKKALEDLERNRENGADAVKIYAGFLKDGKCLPVALNDPEFGYPMIERAIELGYRVIATHKAIPVGPVSAAPFGMFDLPEACYRYPEIQFEVVHAGFAFVEETTLLVGSFPNVWLNLEGSNSLIIRQPRRFAEFLGEFMANAGAEDRIQVGSGTPLVHPGPLFDAIIDFEMPRDLVEGRGYPEITMDMKRKFLGGNFLRLHQIDRSTFEGKVGGDAWASRQSAEGVGSEAWSHIRHRWSEAGQVSA